MQFSMVWAKTISSAVLLLLLLPAPLCALVTQPVLRTRARRYALSMATSPDASHHHHALALLKDCVDATITDKRRVDEVVGQFAYAGSLAVGDQLYSGQGAVKRGLTRLLSGLDSVHLAKDTLVLSYGDDTIELRANFDAAGLIESASVDGARQSVTIENVRDGPKWETDDGRVVQQIWQQRDLLAPGNHFLKEKMELGSRLVCIVDSTVAELYGDKLSGWCESMQLDLDMIKAPGNEDEKTIDNVMYMIDELARVDPLRRSEPVLAIGGGVLTDTAGFACALWRRGIPWCRMPTTLLGMVDASVGIKVAVNYHRKNGIGHFFSPIHTFIDETFLPTLSLADVRSGCGEIMKAALVHDRTLFDLMQVHGEHLIETRFCPDPETESAASVAAAEIIKRSVDTMLDCIGPDLWEETLLRPMDFGHSFSRTLETCQAFKLRHGEAVAIDCVMSTMLANVKGFVSDSDADQVLQLYAKLKLPCSIKGITEDTYKRATREIIIHRDGILRAPLPRGIGSCVFVDSFTDEEIDAAFAKLERFMENHPETYWDRSKSFDPGFPNLNEDQQPHARQSQLPKEETHAIA